MSKNNFIDNKYYVLENDKTTFVVFRDLSITGLENIKVAKKKNCSLTLVFDLENLNLTLEPNIIVEIISKNKPDNIIIKNSRIGKPSNLYYKNDTYELTELFISDELYSMSGNLDILFGQFRPKKLTLKHFKINSNAQIHKFLEFINNIGCTELVLEDIYIELLIKESENDETFNQLKEFISFENGKFYIFNEGSKKPFEKKELKKLTLIDCPLFAITEKTFQNIKNYKDISINIDENSLINPSIITKFEIKDGYSYICFDLDSYKLNEENAKDNADEENIKDNADEDNAKDNADEEDIKDNANNYKNFFKLFLKTENHKFRKLVFKNFDITKYEYITGENLTFIDDEDNWVLNSEERKRKEKFEEIETIYKDIVGKINKNKNFLSELEELTFDNCTNFFIELILKLINSSKNELKLLKIKKCGKEYFDLKNILSLNIEHLILFDTPLIVDKSKSKKEIDNKDDDDKFSNLKRYDGKLGKYEHLTIKIMSLEHYCTMNNLNYYNTMKIIVELIRHDNFNQNLCFESNALPIIMTFLITKPYYDKFCYGDKDETIEDNDKDGNKKDTKGRKYNLNPYYYFIIFDGDNKKEFNSKKEKIEEGIKERNNIINKSFNIGLKNKNILIKKNNIKNTLENYDFLLKELFKVVKKEEEDSKGKLSEDKKKVLEKIEGKNDFGSDIFNFDIDYGKFFKLNNIKGIEFEKCLFSHYVTNQKYSILKFDINETIINMISEGNKDIDYIIDMKTINEIIFKNKNVEDISYLCLYLSLKENTQITQDIIKYLNNLVLIFGKFYEIFNFFEKLEKPITVKLENIKEKKEFYCLLNIFEILKDKENKEKISFKIGKENEKNESFNLPKIESLKNILKLYFLQDKNEKNEDVPTVFNYYYTDVKEKELFEDYSNKKNKFKIIYGEHFWDFIMK